MELAKKLLGKVLRVKYKNNKKDIWLSAIIIETESYYLDDKGSHAFLGYTEKRKALFMPPGTIYMYYARGGDSLNFSALGKGNAVLIKSAFPYLAEDNSAEMLSVMQKLNPAKNNSSKFRVVEKLCGGQTLLCRSLCLKVADWDAKQFDSEKFYVEDVDYKPDKIIQTKRLGIPKGRDEHLLYRFIDCQYARYATVNPLRKRNLVEEADYLIIKN